MSPMLENPFESRNTSTTSAWRVTSTMFSAGRQTGFSRRITASRWKSFAAFASFGSKA